MFLLDEPSPVHLAHAYERGISDEMHGQHNPPDHFTREEIDEWRRGMRCASFYDMARDHHPHLKELPL